MSEKFEDLMKPSLTRLSLVSGGTMPDIVHWINLLSALCFTSIITVLGDHESVGDTVFVFAFNGMVLGSVVFLIGHGISTMCGGGKGSLWISTGLFTVMFMILLFAVYSVYGLSWLI